MTKIISFLLVSLGSLFFKEKNQENLWVFLGIFLKNDSPRDCKRLSHLVFLFLAKENGTLSMDIERKKEERRREKQDKREKKERGEKVWDAPNKK